MLGGALVSVFIGAGLGACARYGLSRWLNPSSPSLPLGTLASNLVGGYLVGVAVALLAGRADWPVEVRLFLVTGFLGGLTTFSAFSAEVVDAVLRGEPGWALAEVAVHVLGSLAFTAAGIWSVRWMTAPQS